MSAVNRQIVLQLTRDGVVIGPQASTLYNAVGINETISLSHLDIVGKGAHTYKIQWRQPAGTDTATSDSTSRHLIVVELA